MNKKTLLVAGSDEAITKVLDYIKDNDMISKKKLFLVDLFPELTEEYKEEQGMGGNDV